MEVTRTRIKAVSYKTGTVPSDKMELQNYMVDLANMPDDQDRTERVATEVVKLCDTLQSRERKGVKMVIINDQSIKLPETASPARLREWHDALIKQTRNLEDGQGGYGGW